MDDHDEFVVVGGQFLPVPDHRGPEPVQQENLLRQRLLADQPCRPVGEGQRSDDVAGSSSATTTEVLPVSRWALSAASAGESTGRTAVGRS